MVNKYYVYIITFIFSFHESIGSYQNPFDNEYIETKRQNHNIKTIYNQFLIFFDKNCLSTQQQLGRDPIHKFLNEFPCSQLNTDKTDDFIDIGNRFIVIDRDPKCIQDNKKKCDLYDYCIVEVDENEEMSLCFFNPNINCENKNVASDLWNLNVVSPQITNGFQHIVFNSLYDPNFDIVVMDTGIDITHSEFNGIQIERIYDAFPNNFFLHSHGTHVSGTILGENYGIFKPHGTQVKLLDVRILDSNGRGTLDGIFNGYNAIINYINTTGRKCVINMSFGASKSNEMQKLLKRLRKSNGISVAAAGNEGQSASNVSPAASSDVITVGAHDENNQRPYWSNYGNAVDIWSPGTNIVSAVVGGGAGLMSGTSMATPLVVGVIANILVTNNNLNFKDIKKILIREAVNDVTDLLGKVNLPRVQYICAENHYINPKGKGKGNGNVRWKWKGKGGQGTELFSIGKGKGKGKGKGIVSGLNDEYNVDDNGNESVEYEISFDDDQLWVLVVLVLLVVFTIGNCVWFLCCNDKEELPSNYV